MALCDVDGAGGLECVCCPLRALVSGVERWGKERFCGGWVLGLL